MRNECDNCKLDQDGRCQECMNLMGSFITKMTVLQQEFAEKIRVATKELEDQGQTVSKNFKSASHQCLECIRSNGDAAIARLIRNISSDSPLSLGMSEEVYGSLKNGLLSMGINQTPLLDKAWAERQET